MSAAGTPDQVGVATADLLAWMGERRWFAHKTADASVLQVGPTLDLGWLGDESAESAESAPRTRIELVTVSDGTRPLVYQLPLTYRAEEDASLDYALVGRAGDAWVYDGLRDPAGVSALVGAFEHPDAAGDVSFTLTEPTPVGAGSRAVALNAEQSNTSLVVDDGYLLKVFRTVVPGRNPDIEVLEHLSATHGDSVVPLRGFVTADVREGGELDPGAYDLGMLQDFLRTATDGWDSARASVRDLMSEADLYAEEVGGDWAGEAERLGLTTAHVHEALATYFPTESWGAGELGVLAGRLRDRWDAAATEVGPTVDLEPLTAAAHALFDAVAASPETVTAQRVHGDFHLGQTLRTSKGWKLIDFEGEPGRPLAERTALDHPLRDVAGMLRSLDYAAHSVLLQVGGDLGQADQLAHRAREWVDRNSAAYLRGCDLDDLTGTDRLLLAAYEVDKAAYELVYEARNRPTWLPIPQHALERLLTPR